MADDELIVYWSPGQFTSDEPRSWNQFYSEPSPVSAGILDKKSNGIDSKSIFACPAYAESVKNLFEVQSVHEEHVSFPSIFFDQPPTYYPIQLPVESVLSFESPRESSLKGHLDIAYNMSWLFFSEESVQARFTSPYFPAKSPSKNALLATGVFDIGIWFRNFNLNYLVPNGSYDFDINIGDPLFYIQILTDKKVTFKRFIHTSSTQKLAEEFAQAANIRGKKFGMSFSKRYDLSKKTNLPKLVLSEIKKNLVE